MLHPRGLYLRRSLRGGCQNTRRTFVSEYALFGALLSVTYIPPFVIRWLLMHSGKHPGERERGLLQNHVHCSLRHEQGNKTQRLSKQSEAFRRAGAVKFITTLSCFQSPNRTNLLFDPVLTGSRPEWVTAFLTHSKLFLLLKLSMEWYNFSFSVWAVFLMRPLMSWFNLAAADTWMCVDKWAWWPSSGSSEKRYKFLLLGFQPFV